MAGDSPGGEQQQLTVLDSRQWWQTVTAVAVGICLALAVKYVFLRSLRVVSLMAIGLLLAYILDPVLDRLEERGLSRAAAVWLVSLLGLALVGTAGSILVPQLVYQVQDAANNWARYSDTAESLYYHWRTAIEAYSTQHLPDLEVMPFLDEKVDQAGTWLEGHLPNFLQWVSGQLVASLWMVGFGALLALITFHFMRVFDPLKDAVREMLPPATDAEVQRVSTQISQMLGQYLRGVAVVSVSVALVTSLVLRGLGLYFGTKYSLILGLVAGLTYFIPYLGASLSALAGGFFGYVTASHGAPMVSGLVAAGSMLLVNQTFDLVLTPRIVGQRVGLHPLVVLLAIMMGFSLLGVAGMLIATPTAASIKILLARWLPVVKNEQRKAPVLELDLWSGLQQVRLKMAGWQRGVERAATGAVQRGKQGEASPTAETEPEPETEMETEKDGPN